MKQMLVAAVLILLYGTEASAQCDLVASNRAWADAFNALKSGPQEAGPELSAHLNAFLKAGNDYEHCLKDHGWVEGWVLLQPTPRPVLVQQAPQDEPPRQ